MKRIFKQRIISKYILLLFLGLFSVSAYADDIQILRERIYTEYYANSSGNTSYLTSLQTNGLWTDINYADKSITNWAPIVHLERVRSMAKSYCGIADKQSTTAVNLLTGIENALNAWYLGNYKSDNWFFNDIGQQRELGPIVALIYNYLQPTTLTKACNYLVVKSGFTGTNLVWMASMVMIRGAVQNNVSLINQAVTNIGSTVNPVSKGREGIQKDNAYLFHGLQIYNGGYGNWFINDVSLWFYLTRELSIGFPAADIGYLGGLILEGNQWMIRRGQYDFGATGRDITRRWQISSAGLKNPAERMKGIDFTKSAKYQALINHINGNKNDNITGNKQFYRADLMVQRRAGYYLSVKMCSSRTNGTEFMNGENAKGYWLPFGATCLMKDALEYNSIFPLWDWTKVPGVTAAEETPSFGATLNQPTNFVGGVSDRNCGVANLDLNIRNLLAKKSWFMFNGETVALGAGISSTNANSITTSLAQSVMRNNVYVNSKIANEAIGGNFSKVKSIWHDNVAYIFPDSTNIKLTNSYKVGSWFDINTSQPKDAITSQIFNPWIDHGKNPTNAAYAYIIVPEITNANVANYLSNNTINILQNTAQIQAVTQTAQKLTGIVFHTAGQLVVDNGLTISVNQACALLIDQSSEPVKISISDPSQTKSSITVSLNFKGFPLENMNITMPSGDLSGSTVTKNAQTNREGNYQAVTLTRIPILPLTKDETFTVEKQIICNNCSSVPFSWKSSNEAVATVNQEGVITAIANGEAEISITLSESNKTETCTVEVMDKVLVEVFDNINNVTALPGGTWDIEGGNLRLTNPVGATIPSPENNIAILKQDIAGDFVMSANLFVDETSSIWNDVCLIWGHQQPTNSYFYAHLCENNDDAGSGIFKITNGTKSVQLTDIGTPFTSNTWHTVILKKKANEVKLYMNNQLIATTNEPQFATGKIGFGTYNDLCRFDSVNVWQYATNTYLKNIDANQFKIRVVGNEIQIESDSETVKNVKVFDIQGRMFATDFSDSRLQFINNLMSLRSVVILKIETNKSIYYQKLLLL